MVADNLFCFESLQDYGSIYYSKQKLLDNIVLSFSLNRGCTISPRITNVTIEDKKTIIDYDSSGYLKFFRLIMIETDGVIQLTVDTECPDSQIYPNNTFASYKSISIKFDFVRNIDGMLSNYIEKNGWWQNHSFIKDISKVAPVTQSLLIKSDELHIHILPLVSDCFRSELCGSELILSVGCGGERKIFGTALSVAVKYKPYEAVEANISVSHKLNSIHTTEKEKRVYPKVFEYFGWCTWNAFYHDVSSEKIYSKLNELKEKGVPVKWVLIDDGWSCVKGEKLYSFKEDKEKFPEGLKRTIKKIKSEYGVEYVGVWHAFTGYWLGIEKDSPVYNEQKENLMQTNAGWIIPSVEPEKAYAFWNAWHSYLRKQGIDFVKVDNQSSYSTKIDEVIPTSKGVRIQHEAMERSIDKNFGGALINCMGMNMENILNRPSSAINRNSDDFFPDAENGFIAHICQNVYNTPVHGKLYYCDFDMWWSMQEAALQSSILRAISGGPIYISDKISCTSLDYILPLVNKEGKIYRCDDAAKPTHDCLYKDCVSEYYPLKIFNKSKENIVVAAFNLNDITLKGSIELSDIPNAHGLYAAQNFFTKEFVLLDENSKMDFILHKNGVALWNLYPVKNGMITLGDPDKYIGCASELKTDNML